MDDFGFGAQDNNAADDNAGGAGWDNVDLFANNNAAPQRPPLDFAKQGLVEVFSSSKAAQKGLIGIRIEGHFFMTNDMSKELQLGLNITNLTDQPLSDFDIQINKNPFAIFTSGMANRIQLPAPGQSVYGTVPMVIDKKNQDAKNPPKTPFNVQIAMRTNRDVFFFEVPCKVHNLIAATKEMSQ